MTDLYTRIGDRISTDGARELAGRLSAWHDAMVMHERRQRFHPDGSPCSDACPHALAAALWREAREVFGSAARDLQFLRSRAARAVAAVEA